MRVELLCVDVDGTLTDGSLIYGFANSASCGDFLGSASARFVNEPKSSISSLASHNPKNSSTILEFASHKNAESTTNFAEFALDSAKSQNLVNLNPCEAPLISPASWCKKSESKGAEVPPADFLLEAEKRGTPHKSEKRQLLARRGSGEGGAALLREKTSKIDGKGSAEFNIDSQGGLPRRFCESARNDKILDSSLRLRSAQNDKIKKSQNDNFGVRVAESSETTPQDEFGEILKVFNAKDGLALAYWTKSLNRKVAIITGKKSEILRHRARELGINLLFMGVSDKGAIVRGLKKDLGLDSAQIAAIGDDLNDISMFAESSLNFAPRDCAQHLKTLPNIEILRCKGGRGAVREAIESILQKEGIYEDFISVFAR